VFGTVCLLSTRHKKKLSKVLSAEDTEGAENQDNSVSSLVEHIFSLLIISALIFEHIKQLYNQNTTFLMIDEQQMHKDAGSR